MNLGQTMISALALLLLTVLVLNANRLIIRSGEDMMTAEALDAGVTLAQSLLEEIETKWYDLAISDGNYPNHSPSSFTGASSLGPSSTERSQVPLPDQEPFKSAGLGDLRILGSGPNYSGYNDIDDYHGYYRIANAGGFSGFRLDVQVYYVTSSNPDVSCGYRTFYKRVDVTVTHPTYIPSSKPMRFSAVMAY